MHVGILLFLAALAFALRGGVEFSRTDYRKGRDEAAKKAGAPGAAPSPAQRAQASRNHARTWWAREILGGFPIFRTGAHAGWLAHRAAEAQARARREEQVTNALEVEASYADGIADHKARQREARGILGRLHEKISEADEPVRGRRAVKAALAQVVPFMKPEPRPASDGANAPGAPAAQDRPSLRAVPDPEPATGPAPTEPELGAPAETEGEPVTAADVTYDQAIALNQSWMTAADEDHAVIDGRQRDVSALIDGLHGADANPELVAAVMHYNEVTDRVKQGISAAADAADAIQHALDKHRDLAEAHQNAPVRAASREFYEA